MGLQLRRRQRRGPRRDEEPAGRQGRQPGRDEQSRPAGAAGLHHHHRGLHLFLRQRQDLSRRPEASRSRPRSRRSSSAIGASSAIRTNPLLVSVRSGARASMPGMMDTVLNLGLNDHTVEGWPSRPAMRASPTTAIAASSRCTPTSCSASTTIISRKSSRQHEARHRARRSTPSLTAEDWQRRDRGLQGHRRARARQSRSRRIRRSSSGARSARCSAPG